MKSPWKSPWNHHWAIGTRGTGPLHGDPAISESHPVPSSGNADRCLDGKSPCLDLLWLGDDPKHQILRVFFFLSIYQKKEYIQVSLGKSTPNFVLFTEHFPHTQAALPWSGCASWFPCSGSAWGAPLRVPRCVRKGGSPVGMMLWNREDFCTYIPGRRAMHTCM